MKYLIIALAPVLLMSACSPSQNTSLSSKPSEGSPHDPIIQKYIEENSQYVAKKPSIAAATAKALGKDQWQVSADTVLKLMKRNGKNLENAQFHSNSKWEIIQNGITIETDKMSYELMGGKELSKRKIFTANNAFLINEAPSWNTQQYILFTRQSEDSSWQSRYVQIPSIPTPGHSEFDILEFTNAHILIQDGANYFRYPISILKTTNADNPFATS